MKISSFCLLGLAFIACTTKVSAAPNSLFGIQLGVELNIPECHKNEFGYDMYAHVVCFERHDRRATLANEVLSIEFPDDKNPRLGFLEATVLDGRVERFSLKTVGLSSQNFVLSHLVEKYGKPELLRWPVVQNKLGKKFKTIDAIWLKPDLHVDFSSVKFDLNTGEVIVETDKGYRNRVGTAIDDEKARLSL